MAEDALKVMPNSPASAGRSEHDWQFHPEPYPCVPPARGGVLWTVGPACQGRYAVDRGDALIVLDPVLPCKEDRAQG